MKTDEIRLVYRLFPWYITQEPKMERGHPWNHIAGCIEMAAREHLGASPVRSGSQWELHVKPPLKASRIVDFNHAFYTALGTDYPKVELLIDPRRWGSDHIEWDMEPDEALRAIHEHASSHEWTCGPGVAPEPEPEPEDPALEADMADFGKALDAPKKGSLADSLSHIQERLDFGEITSVQALRELCDIVDSRPDFRLHRKALEAVAGHVRQR